jgi:hypothetical protein
MRSISHLDVQNILHGWQTGALTEGQVHAWAENRFAVGGYEPESDACNAVLAQLDCMNMNLLTAEDIPLLLDALTAADAESVLAKLGGPETSSSVCVSSRRTRSMRPSAASAPNYVFKPTAGDGLQLFRLLPAGSGLTRR